MNIGIVGLGLIGGSLARAFKTSTNHTLYGLDKKRSSLDAALCQGVVDWELTESDLGQCDLVIVALYPDATIDYVRQNCTHFKKDVIVIDCCGVKEHVCTPLFELAQKESFSFYGGHPMSGTQFSGYENSRADMFKDASMIIIPPPREDKATTELLKNIFREIGFGYVTLSDARTHDKIIAYTSQLAHVVSSAYIKSPSALIHTGYSAGSFRDLTRVAALNADMWTELFLENSLYLAKEIDNITRELEKYSTAIKNKDAKALHDLLEEGTRLKNMSL